MITLPAIAYVQKKYPADKLTLIGRPEYGALLKTAGIVDEVLSWDRREFSGLFQEPTRADAALARWLQGFHLALGWTHQASGAGLEHSLRSLGQKNGHFIVHDPFSSLSLSEFFFQKTVAYFEGDFRPLFPFEKCARLLILPNPGVAEQASPSVIIHPGSGSVSKCWPLADFLEIIHRLSAKKIRGVLVTGEAEERLKSELGKTKLPRGWRWLASPPLAELSRILAGSSLYLGNDSGITHLAAACGTTVVALFRNDLKALWKPFGRTHIISADSLPQISPKTVWSTVSRLIDLP